MFLFDWLVSKYETENEQTSKPKLLKHNTVMVLREPLPNILNAKL